MRHFQIGVYTVIRHNTTQRSHVQNIFSPQWLELMLNRIKDITIPLFNGPLGFQITLFKVTIVTATLHQLDRFWLYTAATTSTREYQIMESQMKLVVLCSYCDYIIATKWVRYVNSGCTW